MRLLIESDWFVTKSGNFVLLEWLRECFKKFPVHLVHSYLDLLSTRNYRVVTLAYSNQRGGVRFSPSVAICTPIFSDLPSPL